jgi:hypothetical protein
MPIFPHPSRIPGDPGAPTCRLLSLSNTILYVFFLILAGFQMIQVHRVSPTLCLTLFYNYFPHPCRIPDDPGAPCVAYSLCLALYYNYFPQPSQITDDLGLPCVVYSFRLTLFYIYIPQPSRIPDDPGAPCVAYSLRLALFNNYFLSLAGFQMILVRHVLPTVSV